MSDGHTLVLGRNREIAHRVIDCAPAGSVVKVKPPRRTLAQNDRMWALLTEISAAKPEGRELTPDVWKALFLHALDHAQRFELALDGRGMVPVGFRSSKLSKEQMGDLMTLIEEYGARHGVAFSDSDRSGEAGETRSGSTVGESAGRDSGIAQTPSEAK